MKHHYRACGSIVVAVLLSVAADAQAQARYSATQTGDIVQLRDSRTDTTVSVMTTVSNAYEMVVKGQNLIRMTFAHGRRVPRAAWPQRHPAALAPFANRLDEQAFYANGKKYNFDMELGNVRGAIPIHGFLSSAKDWKLVEAKADGKSAWVTSRLDFYRNPQWMKQFPFAHTLEMTYRLVDGVLEVKTRDREPQRRADAGGHRLPPLLPADRLHARRLDALDRREDALAAGRQQDPDRRDRSDDKFFPNRKAVALKDLDLDHVFGDLERDAQGRAVMSVKGKTQQLDVLLGPNYRDPSCSTRRTRPTHAAAVAAVAGAARRPRQRRLQPRRQNPRCRLPGSRTRLPTVASSPSNRWSGSPIR